MLWRGLQNFGNSICLIPMWMVNPKKSQLTSYGHHRLLQNLLLLLRFPGELGGQGIIYGLAFIDNGWSSSIHFGPFLCSAFIQSEHNTTQHNTPFAAFSWLIYYYLSISISPKAPPTIFYSRSKVCLKFKTGFNGPCQHSFW